MKTETITNSKGRWFFDSYIPGDYIIRLKYGDHEETMLPGANSGLNEKSYNGHDYKSTAYNVVLDEDFYYDLAKNNLNPNHSKAKDKEARRLENIQYSSTMINENAEKLAKFPVLTKDDPDYQELVDKTFMYADTATIVCDIEYNPPLGQAGKETLGDMSYKYNLQNMNFGIEERPKASLEVQKEIENIRVILGNGTVMVNTAENLRQNVVWIAQDRTDGYPKKENKKGLVEIFMDDEMIQGATIEITYKMTITNTGEVDSFGQDGGIGETYYTGKESSSDKTVTTRVGKVIDYLEKSLTYMPRTDMTTWKKMSEVISQENPAEMQKYLNTDVITVLTSEYRFNPKYEDKTLVTEALKETSLKPGESAEIKMTTRKIMSLQDPDDKLSYDNMVELIEVSNDVGRRDYEAIPGNQIPIDPPAEPDASYAETVRILKPTGADLRKVPIVNLIIIVSAGLVFIAGAVLIQKKVLKHK